MPRRRTYGRCSPLIPLCLHASAFVGTESPSWRRGSCPWTSAPRGCPLYSRSDTQARPCLSANGTFVALCLAYTRRYCANVCMPDATQNPCRIQLTGQGSTGMDPQEVVGVLPRDGGGEEGAPSTCAKLSTAQQQVVNSLGNRRSFCQVKVLAVYVFVCLWHTRDCLSTIPARAEMNIQSESVRRLHASQSWGVAHRLTCTVMVQWVIAAERRCRSCRA